MELTPLRVWQLSQAALSGMMAGLLKQPRTRVGPEAFQRSSGESNEALKKRVETLEKELARTEDLVRVLRMAPWAPGATDSTAKEAPRRATKRRRQTSKASKSQRVSASTKAPARSPDPDRRGSPGSDAARAGDRG